MHIAWSLCTCTHFLHGPKCDALLIDSNAEYLFPRMHHSSQGTVHGVMVGRRIHSLGKSVSISLCCRESAWVCARVHANLLWLALCVSANTLLQVQCCIISFYAPIASLCIILIGPKYTFPSVPNVSLSGNTKCRCCY